ncbi:putative leader peptide [Streptomyces sp. TP-A0874]
MVVQDVNPNSPGELLVGRPHVDLGRLAAALCR